MVMGPRCCANTTIADTLPIRLDSCAKLVKKLHATVDEQLLFFEKDEARLLDMLNDAVSVLTGTGLNLGS